MMIELKATGMCEYCSYQKLEVIPAAASYSFSKLWDVRCVHQNACDRIARLYGKGTEIEVNNDNDNNNSITSS